MPHGKTNRGGGKPLFASRREASKAIGISYPTLDALLKSGRLKSVRVGRRILIPLAELERLAIV
jgi:excisionase family DNA binding protein